MPVKYIYTLFVVLSLSFLLQSQTEMADYWIKQADLVRETDFVSASRYCDSVFKFARKTGNKVYLARAYNTFGNLQLAKGNYKTAIENFDTAQIILPVNNNIYLASIINNKGICQERLGNYSLSLKLHLQSLKLREELGLPKEILIGQQNIGVVYFYIGDIPQSIKYTNMALETALKIKDSLTACQLYDNLGATYFNAFKDSLALVNYTIALDLAKKMKYEKGIENVSNNLSAFYLETGKPELAKKYLKTAMEYLNENPMNKISLLHNMGKGF
mgnify:CR=1 FL=1